MLQMPFYIYRNALSTGSSHDSLHFFFVMNDKNGKNFYGCLFACSFLWKRVAQKIVLLLIIQLV